MAHFTCVGATVDELRTALDEMAGLNFENVLAQTMDVLEGSYRVIPAYREPVADERRGRSMESS